MSEGAATPVPRAEEVRPGVWALPLPMPGPLAHVFAYAVALDDGMLLIDAGPDDDLAFAALRDGLHAAGAELGDLRAVLFTHAHPDHYGAAARLRETTDAWLGLHRADAELLALVGSESRADGLVRLAAWLRELGADSDETARILDMIRAFALRPPHPQPDRYIADGDTFRIAGGAELVAIHTPGHAPGHVCFAHRDADLVFTGDHVLSPTTPNVSISRFTTGNPLADYIEALVRMAGLGDILGLPGHQDRVRVAARAREIIAHHESQLDSVCGILGAGPRTVRDVAGEMEWAFAWERFGPGSVFMALGEALAHLAVLEQRGEVERFGSGPERWQVRSAGL